ncbi:flavodoxin family protein [Planctomycetales bacterium]|nr:flavodoxin family protein [Planctomycetales bacterium]
MKIIGINGSPRSQGNTAKLLSAFLDGASGGGAATTAYFLEGLRLHGCVSCMACKNNDGFCAIDDDMQKIYAEIQAASALMLAFPLYMWQMTAQTKLLVDRLYAFLRPDFTNLLRGEKKLLLGVTQGNPDAEKFKPYLANTAAMLKFVGFDVVDTIVVAGTRDTADIEKQTAKLAQAREWGEKLARA